MAQNFPQCSVNIAIGRRDRSQPTQTGLNEAKPNEVSIETVLGFTLLSSTYTLGIAHGVGWVPVAATEHRSRRRE